VGLKDRLRRLQKVSGEHTTELVCQEYGERMRVPRDIALRITRAVWLKRRAERRGEPVASEDDPVMKLIESHPHDALVDVRTGRPPGLPGRPGA
jgi:hypothetical protein